MSKTIERKAIVLVFVFETNGSELGNNHTIYYQRVPTVEINTGERKTVETKLRVSN
jgi:hypothetical protein